jgi:DNA-binding XRE family transcriptional regulator
MTDYALLARKLRALRRETGLTQEMVAIRSGIGEKTISSFETGSRIGSIKLWQLKQIAEVFGLNEARLLNWSVDHLVSHVHDNFWKGTPQ